MKYLRTVFIFFCIFCSMKSFSQGKFYLGVNGGYTAATADLFHSVNGYFWESGFVGGFQGGVVGMHFFREHIGFQSGVQFVQKGWKQKFDVFAPDHHTYLDYIEVPLLAHLYTGKGRLHFFVNGGIYFEYMVNSKVDPVPEETGGYDFYLFDENRDQKYGYGYKVGGGVYFDFRFGTIMLEGSGSYSLSNVFNYDQFSTGIPNLSNKINVAGTIGYLVTFGAFENKEN